MGASDETASNEATDGTLPYYRRSANRASMAPGYEGRHNIGFRIVEAPFRTRVHGIPRSDFTSSS